MTIDRIHDLLIPVAEDIAIAVSATCLLLLAGRLLAQALGVC